MFLLFSIGTASAFEPALVDLVEDEEFGIDLSNVSPDFDPYVVGGAPSAPGSWQSTVVLVHDSMYQVCTGTLIDDDIVLTAAHCIVGLNITHVVSGTTNVAQSGDWTAVSQIHVHPTYNDNGGSDIAVIELNGAAGQPPTTLATGCAANQYVYDGGTVAIVGFGAISLDGNTSTTQMHEAYSTVRDHDCSEDFMDGQWTACDPALRPAREIYAGGNGVDACFGDSGGPLYVPGQYGEWYLAGVTSRGAQDANGNPCGGGGVWVRPDAHLAWIQSSIGRTLPVPTCQPPQPEPPPAPPEPEPEPEDEQPTPQPTDPGLPPVAQGAGWSVAATELIMKKDTLGAVQLQIDAVDPAQLQFEISSDGVLGTAETQPDGLVLYRPFKGATGADAVRIRITDTTGAVAELDLTVQIYGGMGCSNTGGASGWLALAGLALVPGLRRRR